MINAIIIDDEQNCMDALHNLLTTYCKEVTVLSTFSSVQESIKEIGKYPVDVVFLDIMIGKETGFDILNSIQPVNFSVVFTTAHEDFALKAFRYAAIDYLLKPIDIDDLKNTIEKLKDIKERANFKTKLENFIKYYQPNTLPTQLTLSSKNEIEFVNIDEIIFCEADGFYTKFYIENNKEIFVTKNLKEYEDLLPPHFFRIHKSYLINRNKVKKIIKTEGGSVIMSNGKTLPISQRKKDQFLEYVSRMV